jgi:hypothetical protein
VGDDPAIRWELASPSGILIDHAADAWHSGHVTHILELPDADSLLVATETGGVWSVTGGLPAIPYSEKWEDPDSKCLAFGPDGPRHVFAGCSPSYPPPEVDVVPTIMETNAAADIPLLEWMPVDPPLPADAGGINAMVVIPHLRRIVVACRASDEKPGGGVYWSTIPDSSFGPNPAPRAPYVWHRAVVVDGPRNGFNDLAVASTNGAIDRDQLENQAELVLVAAGMSNGLYFGQWEADQLVLRRARQVAPDDVTVTLFDDASASSVDSCKARPNVVYSACARMDGTLMQVVRSDDGGRTWKMCGTQVPDAAPGALLPNAGAQGVNWNNCVGVDPQDPSIVALGWQHAGPILSLDGGENWHLPDSAHLHADVHCVLFSRKPAPPTRTVFVGSDGGVASMTLNIVDGIASGHWQPDARSDYNRNLPTLQCYCGIFRQVYGSLDGSARRPGLVAAGLQDNGNVWAHLDQSDPWEKIDGGDGGWNAFLSDGSLVHNTKGEAVKITAFPTANQADTFIVPGELVGPYGEPVVQPSYRNAAGHLLAAAGATGGKVFGLWINDDPDSTYYWEPLVSLPDDAIVGALCSYDGKTVYAGTHNDGRMFAIDVAQKSWAPQPVLLPKPSPNVEMRGGSFIRIVAFDPAGVFALLDGARARPIDPMFPPPAGTVLSAQSYVVRLDGAKWTPPAAQGLPGRQMYGAVAVTAEHSRVPRGLLVCTDEAVYVSRDEGESWQRASGGLPRRPHCADMRFVPDGKGHGKIYLGTYGRSVWRASI